MVKVIVKQGGPKKQTFEAFNRGDFLVSDTGNVGIKVSSETIKWLTVDHGTPARPHHITHNVPAYKGYRVPNNVTVTVEV